MASLLPIVWGPENLVIISLTVQKLRYRVDRQAKISGQAHKRTLLKTMPPSLRGWWLLLKQPECIFTKQNNNNKLSTAQTPLATPYQKNSDEIIVVINGYKHFYFFSIKKRVFNVFLIFPTFILFKNELSVWNNSNLKHLHTKTEKSNWCPQNNSRFCI